MKIIESKQEDVEVFRLCGIHVVCVMRIPKEPKKHRSNNIDISISSINMEDKIFGLIGSTISSN